MTTKNTVFSRLFDEKLHKRLLKSEAKKVDLSLREDVGTSVEALEEIENFAEPTNFEGAINELSDAFDRVFELTNELESYVDQFRGQDYPSVVSKAEDSLNAYRNGLDELGLPLTDDAIYLEELLTKWEDYRDIYNTLPLAEELINKAKSL
jgi:hypothetical protein